MKLFSLCAISSATGFILQTTPVAPVGYNQTTVYDLDDVLSPTTTTTASTGTASKKVKMMIYSSPGSWVWGPPTDSWKCGPGIGDCLSGLCCSEHGWCGSSSAYCDNPKHDFRPFETEYTGECFNDYGNTMWPESQYHEDPNNNAKDYCRNRCSSMGFQYYGLQARTWCNCGNEAPNSNSIVDQSECNMVCPGNPDEICGGDWRMNVYTIRSTNKDFTRYANKDAQGLGDLFDQATTGVDEAKAICRAHNECNAFSILSSSTVDNHGTHFDDNHVWFKRLQPGYIPHHDNDNLDTYLMELDCKAGFDFDLAAGKCIDINECADDARCGDNAKCTNTEGSYTCTCNTGFTLVSGKCSDVDECDNGDNDCDGNATCSNNDGSFSCDCNDGYSGDGRTCQKVSWVWGPPIDSWKCGPGIGDCLSGFCCSRHGWCGSSSAYCWYPQHDFRPFQ